jgi:glycosyltransferase involved in cell wall biosynthesis
MKILFLTKYDTLAASSRLRAYQFQEKMDLLKYEVEVKPLLSNYYLKLRFNNKRANILYLIFLFLKRVYSLIGIVKYDVIVIHIELFPFLPAFFERLLFFSNKKIYFDYDDAVYHNYDMSNNIFIKFFLASKIKFLMKNADGIIAGNKYTETYAKKSGATNVLILPTVINIDHYVEKAQSSPSQKIFTIGWIGSPSTSKYLKLIARPLKRLGKITPVRLYLVGASKKLNFSIDNVEITSVAWSLENEQKALREFDVGIMPLFDERWEKGKCAFKLIQYMASFLPVVSSDVGMNSEIINDHENGLLASSSDEWFDSLYKIYKHHDIRQVMGFNGRTLVEKEFTIQSRLGDFEEFINKTLVQPVEAISLHKDPEKLSTLNNYSVVTIGLNCASTISRTIESVLQQKILPKQYIFVLGKSKDDTYNIIFSYKPLMEEKGIEFFLLDEVKGSVAAIPSAWNTGIEMVDSDIVAILNSDDFYSSRDTMLNVLTNFKKSADYLIISGRINHSNSSTFEKSIINTREFLIKTIGHKALFPYLNPYNHPATFVSKKLYDKIGLYNVNYVVSSDYEFLYRAFSLGYKPIINDEVIVSMQPGGFASKHKNIGRREAYKIATSYTSFNILPGLAFIIRFILRR